MRVLQDISQMAVEPELASLAVIPPINQNPPPCRLKKPAGKVDQRTFSSARFPYNCNGGAGGNL